MRILHWECEGAQVPHRFMPVVSLTMQEPAPHLLAVVATAGGVAPFGREAPRSGGLDTVASGGAVLPDPATPAAAFSAA